MSRADDARAYADALNAIAQTRRDAASHHQNLADERFRRLDAAKIELAAIHDKRRRVQTTLNRLHQRLAHVPPVSVDRAKRPPAFASLDDLLRALDQYHGDLDEIDEHLHAARIVRGIRRRLLLAVLFLALAYVAVIVAGGDVLLAGGCVALAVGAFVLCRVDYNRLAFIPAAVVVVLFAAIAYFEWTWWQVLIGVVALFIAIGLGQAAVDRVKSDVGGP